MRAATVTEGRIIVEDRPDPVAAPGEVLVHIAAAGLNRADLAQRAGRYPAPPGVAADIPGLEFAGTVVAHGEASEESDPTSVPVGTRVFGLAGGGGQAELLAVPAVQCVPVPDALDDIAAGGVPETFVTAHDAMITQAALQPGETLFVPAAGSGVGTSVIQLATAWDVTTVGAARTQSKLDACAPLGLTHALLTPRELDAEAFAAELRAAAGAIDVTIDLVSGPYTTAAILASAPRGRIVIVGTLAGGTVTLPVGMLMFHRMRLHGTMLRARSVAEKAAATAAFARDVVPLLAAGTVAPVVARTYPLDEVNAAYDALQADEVFGKIVLDLR